MNYIEELRLFNSTNYFDVKDRKCQNTDIEDKKISDTKRSTNCSTGTDTENKFHSGEEIEKQEYHILNQGKCFNPNLIPDSKDSQNDPDALHDDNEKKIENLEANKTKKGKIISPSNQTYQIIEVKDRPEKKLKTSIFDIKKNTSINLESSHSLLVKDNLRIKVIRASMNSIFNYLNNRCKRFGLKLNKVNVINLFGNIRKQRWFVKRKLKYMFASNHDNKRIIIKMIKKDLVFRKLVELKFGDYYNNYFMINNRYLPINAINEIYLAKFESLGKYLEKESKKKKNDLTEEKNEKYLKELIVTGLSVIYEINGEGYYNQRCLKPKFKTKICFIRYN
jgi:hypothetical protein